VYTIVTTVEENEDGDFSTDFDEPFAGRDENNNDIESKNMQNIVAHFLQRQPFLQPFVMWFQADFKSFANDDITKNFTFIDEDGDEQFNMPFASHVRCDGIKIPANVELDGFLDEDGMNYYLNIYILMDFTEIK